ncbi:type II toxin-antitoxin system HipA family toxin [Rahnella woolbedingensis]|uniref:Type II toxin-antitoxin system HipA family toxin n=1 Tax=Rahnella woolbedingensis TaxID=1510574 RepID=A0A419N8E5_9GAMM|nr:HipA domain-containing protein [Rahnella woolbedingensis]RJT43569.1 type II toxin-antitoxin system HipA family toxin [Rahnella woolbedingensis]
MTSESTLLVHAFLPGATRAVPAGKLKITEAGAEVLSCSFIYGLKYLKRKGAIEIDPTSLNFLDGRDVARMELYPANTTLFGGIRDAAPDSWGRRVIEAKFRVPVNSLSESVYLQEAGANRVGALDITADGDLAREHSKASDIRSLGYIQEAFDRVEQGLSVPANLHNLLDAGSSMGGMRPKATLLDSDESHWLAKFSSPNDRGLDIPKVERATLELARLTGLHVPPTQIKEIGDNRFAMLIKRFDRIGCGALTGKRHFNSALTFMNLHEMDSPKSSYAQIADAMRRHLNAQFLQHDLTELYRRMVFNILINHDDDHLRNHGFLLKESPDLVPIFGFQEPEEEVSLAWRLSPLYDVVPRPGVAYSRLLHLGVGEYGREATLTNAISWSERFGLSRKRAMGEIDSVWKAVREWRNCFEEFAVSGKDMDSLKSAFRHAREIGGKELGICD